MFTQYPDAINIYTDGAMDYDTRQTGGTGFVICFPELSEINDIKESFRRDNQGIHRLEMIAILEGMQELLLWIKKNGIPPMRTSRIVIHTDRMSLTDNELLNPYKIAGWKKNGWKNHEGKPIKDDDLLDQIQKIRIKLGNEAKAKIEVRYIRRKRNKQADKLSKKGKTEGSKNKKIIREPYSKIAKRIYDGPEVDYQSLKIDDEFLIRVYKKNSVQNEYEVLAEFEGGSHHGKKISIYISPEQEKEIHRHHFYNVRIEKVQAHHIRVLPKWDEVSTE